MECKVKIGSAYEPKWFEKRFTQGTYSGKNVPLDQDAMWLQDCLLNTSHGLRGSKRLMFIMAGLLSLSALFYFTYL